MRISLRIFAVICLVGATCFITSTIMALPKKLVNSVTATVPIPADSQIKLTKLGSMNQDVPAALAPRKYLSETPISSVAMKNFTVEARGATVSVSADFEMTDRRDEISYLWRLRAVPADGGETISHVYADQIFQVDPIRQVNPKFQEAFELRPGTHTIELSLYSFKKGTDLGFLNDEEMASSCERARGRRKIVIK
jgi:hypothetical protein